MKFFKMNYILFYVTLMLIYCGITESSDRTPRFGLQILRTLHTSYCQQFCNSPVDGNMYPLRSLKCRLKCPVQNKPASDQETNHKNTTEPPIMTKPTESTLMPTKTSPKPSQEKSTPVPPKNPPTKSTLESRVTEDIGSIISPEEANG